jgi:signal transduction histidine kinase
MLKVKDTGIGIPERDIPYIFDRFYRADKSRSKLNLAGFGLGLSMAKRIVEMHNGSIKAKSSPKKGSTFTVKLPIF